MQAVKWLMRFSYKLYLFLVLTFLYYLLVHRGPVPVTYNVTPGTQCYNGKDENVKYILIWTQEDASPLYYFYDGDRSFKNKCKFQNCYVVRDRNFFGGDLAKFDALAFNSRSLMCTNDLPKQRYSHQKYIVYQVEASAHYPVCSNAYDDYFNWTSSYKLNSDIFSPYIEITDKIGKLIAPKEEVNWIQAKRPVNKTVLHFLRSKTRNIAWVTSNCRSLNKREQFAEEIQNELKKYNLEIDIYGKCGNRECLKDAIECDTLLSSYKFYLAFENVFDEDYVTEKVFKAVKYLAVPIVYGGANYSKFLPPNSYIDARKLGPKDLASTINTLLNNPRLYERYFAWHDFYTIHWVPGAVNPVCPTCAALNNKEMMANKSSYKDLRCWLNPNFKRDCVTQRSLWHTTRCFVDWVIGKLP